jgi:hypothetical protein
LLVTVKTLGTVRFSSSWSAGTKCRRRLEDVLDLRQRMMDKPQYIDAPPGWQFQPRAPLIEGRHQAALPGPFMCLSGVLANVTSIDIPQSLSGGPYRKSRGAICPAFFSNGRNESVLVCGRNSFGVLLLGFTIKPMHICLAYSGNIISNPDPGGRCRCSATSHFCCW